MARPGTNSRANFVRSASKRGRYSDGGGLHLQIAKGGTKAWVFTYQRNGAIRAMGLGSARSVPLALARELAAQAREQLARGIDPIDARKAAALAQRAARAKLMTFKECAEEYHAANVTRWTNAKHRDEWISTLRRFAFPVIGHLSVDAIDSALVQKVLQPLVTEKPVTASRLRGRIETVLDYAKAAGRRTGENPADKAIIAHMLPLQSEKANVTHQPALPFAKLPALMHGAARDAGQGGAAARAAYPDRHAQRRRAAGALRRVRPCRRGLDHPGKPDEGAAARPSHPAWPACGRDRARTARRDRWRLLFAGRATATVRSARTRSASCCPSC